MFENEHGVRQLTIPSRPKMQEYAQSYWQVVVSDADRFDEEDLDARSYWCAKQLLGLEATVDAMAVQLWDNCPEGYQEYLIDEAKYDFAGQFPRTAYPVFFARIANAPKQQGSLLAAIWEAFLETANNFDAQRNGSQQQVARKARRQKKKPLN